MPDQYSQFDHDDLEVAQEAPEAEKAPEAAPKAEAPSEAPAAALEEEEEIVTDELPDGFNPNSYMPSPAGPPPHPRTV